MPKIIELKCKGDIESLIKDEFNGEIRQFIVTDLPSNKREKLIKLLSVLIDELRGFEILFEGKIKYAFRDKRIDVVLYKKPKLFLGQFTNPKKLDEKVLVIDNLVGSQKKKKAFRNMSIIGCLFTDKELHKRVAVSLENLAKNELLLININDSGVTEKINNYDFRSK